MEKLQTISTKYRRQQEDGTMPVDFMRHYYDVYSRLQQPSVQAFVGTPPYLPHKDDHFPQADNKNINEKRRLSTDGQENAVRFYERAYEAGSAPQYQGKPRFTEIRATLDEWQDRLKKPGPGRAPLCRRKYDAFLTFVGRRCFFLPIHGLILGPFTYDGRALSLFEEASNDQDHRTFVDLPGWTWGYCRRRNKVNDATAGNRRANRRREQGRSPAACTEWGFFQGRGENCYCVCSAR